MRATATITQRSRRNCDKNSSSDRHTTARHAALAPLRIKMAMHDEGLYDASLGSLPTLIVPDDPLTGAIEKPKTPPPSARPTPPPTVSSPSPRAVLPTSSRADAPAMTPANLTVGSPRAVLPTSPRDDAAATPVHLSMASPRAPTVGPEEQPPPLEEEAAPVTNQVPPVVDQPPPLQAPAAPLPSVTAAPLVPQINSKDFRGMAKRAIALAKLDRLAGGNKSVFDADMNDIGALGIGMKLYFMLTKYLAITFLIMGIMSLPAIVVNLYGNGVTESMVDPLKLAYSSLGNQGVNPDTTTDQDACLPKGYIDCNWTTVDTPFTSDPETVSWIITLSDVSYSFVFLLFYLVYRYKAQKAIDEHMNENLTPAKFAVFVRGLPPDATEKEILEHFNSRYDLTKEEEYHPLWLGCCWGRRRKVKTSVSRNAVNRSKVQNLDHLAGTTSITKELYLDTWIAEVSIGHPTGGLLKTFLSMEALTRSISDTQELVRILEEEKKSAPSSGKNAFKPRDEKLLQQAVKKLSDLNIKMEKKTSKIKALKKGKSLGTGAVSVKEDAKPARAKKVVKAPKPMEHAFDWGACECAFVVFNNVESRRRCLQDYRASTRWLVRRFQPKPLRFRDGKFPLIVVPAPEPSNILWENLEVTDRGRLYRRSFTNFVTFLLLLLSCGIISGAQSAQQEMKKKMVTAGFCDYTLPLVFYGNDSFAFNDMIEWHLVWNQNQTCSAGPNGEARYYIAYDNGIVNDLHINMTAKTYSASTRCTEPCISETSNTTCNTMPCFDQELVDGGEKCETYPETNILYCLCKDAVAESITKYGIFEGPKNLWSTVVPCRGFIRDYLTRNVFMYLAAGIVVIVNLLLKAILRAFATFEAHSSESAKASAVAIKMFSAQFLNTAIIVLVVNASMGLKGLPLLGDLFQGKYKDFERDWYPTVGMGITMTMLINAFVPQGVLFLQMFVVGPITRCLKHRKLRTQEQMNKLYAGPVFDISIRYPMMLNSLFVTMVFCGGSPVLLFIASLTAFGTYWFDKLSIIHLYSVKTAYDEELGETAMAVLPWTLALHLAFSTWMYGNKDLMKSTTVDLRVIVDLLNIDIVEANGTVVSPTVLYNELYDQASKIDVLGEHGLVVKVVRTNAMVVFLFFALLVVVLLLSTVISQLLWPIIRKTLVVVVAAMWRKFKQKWKAAKERNKLKKEKAKATAKVHVDNSPPDAALLIDPTPAQVQAGEATIAEATPGEPGVSLEACSKSPAAVAPLPLAEQPTSPRSLAGRASTLFTPRAAPVVIPEYTDYFRKTIPRRFSPDKKLGFQRNEAGELIRVWQEETVQHGIKRIPGEPMRTWEAMQAPVKSYAIEANSKYRLAVAEIVAAAKRLKEASVAAVAPLIDETAAVQGVDAAIAATEPLSQTATASPPAIDALPRLNTASKDAGGSSESIVQVSIQAE